MLLLRSLAKKYDYQPFFLTLTLFALSYAGLGISMFPTSCRRASRSAGRSAGEQPDLHAVGVSILIPLILAYTAWAYYVFRGKVQAGHGYH